jgi:hypothetical protein
VLQRDPARPWQWSLKSVELAAEQPAMVKAWVGQVRQRLQQLTYRPQQLLVFVNPFGGKRRARRTWQAVAAPILAAAGVDCQVVETAYQVGGWAMTRRWSSLRTPCAESRHGRADNCCASPWLLTYRATRRRPSRR